MIRKLRQDVALGRFAITSSPTRSTVIFDTVREKKAYCCFLILNLVLMSRRRVDPRCLRERADSGANLTTTDFDPTTHRGKAFANYFETVCFIAVTFCSAFVYLLLCYYFLPFGLELLSCLLPPLCRPR